MLGACALAREARFGAAPPVVPDPAALLGADFFAVAFLAGEALSAVALLAGAAVVAFFVVAFLVVAFFVVAFLVAVFLAFGWLGDAVVVFDAMGTSI